jgi:hypothetical protein
MMLHADRFLATLSQSANHAIISKRKSRDADRDESALTVRNEPTAVARVRARDQSLSARACMSITPYLHDFDVDPETRRVLGVALEMTRVSLGLADDFANGIIARRIVELARAGERNPDLLCEGALKELRGHLFGD